MCDVNIPSMLGWMHFALQLVTSMHPRYLLQLLRNNPCYVESSHLELGTHYQTTARQCILHCWHNALYELVITPVSLL